MSGDVLYYVWLSIVCGAGSQVPGKLFDRYTAAKQIYELSPEALRADDDLHLSQDDIIRLSDKNLDRARRAVDYCASNDVQIISCHDSDYPNRLRGIQDYPVVLYVKGIFTAIDEQVCIAIVGTRHMSDYGESVAYCMARGLTSGGATVVSGMALGIDASAHRGALDRGGYTIAVLGCGIDRAYPSENADLMRRISLTGAVITEYSPQTPPIGAHFPVRNRIISGLSQGTLIVEADSRSGALITANTARNQGRDIFAIPGAIDRSSSFGPNKLIKNNARLVTSPQDILTEYEFLYHDRIDLDKIADINADIKKYRDYLNRRSGARAPERETYRPQRPVRVASPKADYAPSARKEPESAAYARLDTLGEIERKIYTFIKVRGALTADEIAAEGYDISEVLSTISVLEIYHFIEAIPGGKYRAK